MRNVHRRVAVAVAAGLLVATGCGGDDDEASDTSTDASSDTSGATEPTTGSTGTPGSDPTTPATGGEGTTPGTGDAAAVDCDPVEDGVLTVVTSLPGPNFWGTTSEETDPDAISSGIEFDLANLVAEACGLEMEFRNESFDAIVAGQVAGDSYDLALSQVTITEARDEVVDFSVPYFKADQGILVQAGTEVPDFAALRALTVGVQAGTTAEFYFLEEPAWQLDSTPQSFPDLTGAYQALSSGQVDAVVIDTPINLGQAAQSDGTLEVVAQVATGEEYGAIYPEGSAKAAVFDEIIGGLVDDGTVNDLIAEYLGGDPSTVPFIELG